MHHIIDGKIGLSSTENTIWRISDPETIINLPRLASNLLTVFVNNNKKSLSRDFLLTAVWTSNGLDASGNSLNNYISIIRRTFLTLGLEDIIITIPKYGFSFNADSIESFPIKEIQPENTNEKEPLENEEPIVQSTVKNNRKLRIATFISLLSYKEALIFIPFIIVIIGFYTYTLIDETSEISPTITIVDIQKKIENCDIKIIYDNADEHTNAVNIDTMQNELSTLVKNKRINCSKNTNLYYINKNLSRTDQISDTQILVAACPKDKTQFCNNIFQENTKND